VGTRREGGHPEVRSPRIGNHLTGVCRLSMIEIEEGEVDDRLPSEKTPTLKNKRTGGGGKSGKRDAEKGGGGGVRLFRGQVILGL